MDKSSINNILETEGKKKIVWTFDEGNPVIKPGQINGKLDSIHTSSACILQIGELYRLFYWGIGDDGKNRICMAESAVDNPNDWKPLGVALEADENSEYNCAGPSFPFVVQVDEKLWYMYYCGWGRPRSDKKIPNTTGLAISEDSGMTWRYFSDKPIIDGDRPYDKNGSGSVFVLREGNEFRMYCTSIGDYFDKPEGVQTGHGEFIPKIGIGYAVSKDGIKWEKPFDHFIVEPRGFDKDPYEYVASKPWIIKDNGIYRMWVHTFGTAYRIRNLISTDGINWSWIPDSPMGDFGIGMEGAFDDKQRCYSCVIKHKDEYRLWYTGNGFGRTGMGYVTGRLSTDG